MVNTESKIAKCFLIKIKLLKSILNDQQTNAAIRNWLAMTVPSGQGRVYYSDSLRKQTLSGEEALMCRDWFWMQVPENLFNRWVPPEVSDSKTPWQRSTARVCRITNVP
jgi:hypothetical protein